MGGLVSALEPVLAARRGSWIGWDGRPAGERDAGAPRSATLPSGITLHGVPLSGRDVRRYYHGLSNRALWPLLHGFLDKAVFSDEDWRAYDRVNRTFAEVVLARAGRDGEIWVHDYHLFLVPRYLREMGFRGRIDFFLHVPFPAPEIVQAFPWRDAVLRGLLACDAVAVHVPSYVGNLAGAVERLLGARVSGEDPRRLELDGRTTLAAAVPIGIDVAAFEAIAEAPATASRARRIRSAHGNRPLLLGADRLDYTKGIAERLRAVDRLLADHPGAAGSFELLQVVVPSRDQVDAYRALKREIDERVGRINGAHAREGWVPIHYRYRGLPREELVAHYRAAAVTLVTPLRDGMNLVAAEFVASRTDDDGVLLVSEFAGVATLLEGALTVNPYDVGGTAEALRRALALPREERRRRMASLRAQVRSNPVSAWADRCLALGRSPAPAPPRPTRPRARRDRTV